MFYVKIKLFMCMIYVKHIYLCNMIYVNIKIFMYMIYVNVKYVLIT